MSNDVIRVGDRFLVEVEVTKNGACDLYAVARPTAGNDGDKVVIGRNILLAGKRLPRPLKVGDRVRVHYGAPVTIKAIDGSDAWVMTEDGGRFTTELNFLTPAEESAS